MKRKHRILNWLSLIIDVGGDLVPIAIAIILLIKYQIQPVKPDNSELLLGILTILLFIASTGLWDRLKRLRRIEEHLEQTQFLLETKVVDRIRADEFFTRSDGPNDESFSTASYISISGITLVNTTSKFSYVLGQRLVAGANIRIILLDTSPEVLHQIILRSWGPTTHEYYKNRIDNTSDFIKIIGKTPKATGTLEVGYLSYVPSFGITMVDPDAPNAAAFVKIYHHNADRPSPAFALTARKDPYWFHFYQEQFELMWKQCRTEKILERGETIFETSTN